MIGICQFIDKCAVCEDNRPLHLEPHQRAILNEAFRTDEDERFIYRTVIYSAPKKSGKTAINALVALWWGFCVQPPDEEIVAANDLDQSVSRVFEAAKGFIKRNPVLREKADIQKLTIRFDNDTVIKAIPSDYAGEAGANQGLVSYDELWGFMLEKSKRLYEELTPVPTRKNSIRFISTYAGWENESVLLQDLYDRIFDKQGGVKPGVKRPLGEDFPVYTVGDLFVYWDHEPRMPWQTPEYYESQRADLRTNTFLRLHENRWVSNESSLFDMEEWDACTDPEHRPPLPNKGIRLFVGCDASTKKDRSAVVSVYRSGNLIHLGPFRTWQPTKDTPMDLEATMETYIRELGKGYTVVECRYDPWQLHRSATTLKKAGIKMIEFPQTVSNLTDIGQAVYDAVKHRSLKLYSDTELRREAAFAVAKETARGIQIIKLKRGHKIDAIVALATSVCAASSVSEKSTPGLFFIDANRPPSEEREQKREQRRQERMERRMERRMDRWDRGL
jgi:phage terminase large subunit-like protein